jgi:effector-binding domain-containing protein
LPSWPTRRLELARAGVDATGPALALYAESGTDETPISVRAALPIAPHEDVSAAGVEVMDLTEVPRAATTVHRGPMSSVEEGYRALARWADEAGEQIDGYSRELYLDCDGGPETWVTELQFALRDTSRKELDHSHDQS